MPIHKLWRGEKKKKKKTERKFCDRWCWFGKWSPKLKYIPSVSMWFCNCEIFQMPDKQAKT